MELDDYEYSHFIRRIKDVQPTRDRTVLQSASNAETAARIRSAQTRILQRFPSHRGVGVGNGSFHETLVQVDADPRKVDIIKVPLDISADEYDKIMRGEN